MALHHFKNENQNQNQPHIRKPCKLNGKARSAFAPPPHKNRSKDASGAYGNAQVAQEPNDDAQGGLKWGGIADIPIANHSGKGEDQR